MAVLTGHMAVISEYIEEDYGKIMHSGLVNILGVVSKAAMSAEQLEESIVCWIQHYGDTEDPIFFKNSIYVIVQYLNTNIRYIPIEIFKKYATEF